MKRIYFILLLFIFISCETRRKTTIGLRSNEIYLKLLNKGQENSYIDLNYGIKISVKKSFFEEDGNENILTRYDANPILLPKLKPIPHIIDFTEESLRQYMQNMGFDIDFDVSSDYLLELVINKFELGYVTGGVGWVGTIKNTINIYGRNKKLLHKQEAIGRSQIPASPGDIASATKSMNIAFIKALGDIDWDKIAYFLNVANDPSLEKNKKVSGEGNTALESTVIRWNIESSPAGARVFWRVVSSSPDVKNTNENYLGSSPYESTETFDIKGLTFSNSGNIQVEIKCSKSGYITQKKRFNLRQVIEQKEISTFFEMIKDD